MYVVAALADAMAVAAAVVDEVAGCKAVVALGVADAVVIAGCCVVGVRVESAVGCVGCADWAGVRTVGVLRKSS